MSIPHLSKRFHRKNLDFMPGIRYEIEAMKTVVREKIELFGSAGRCP